MIVYDKIGICKNTDKGCAWKGTVNEYKNKVRTKDICIFIYYYFKKEGEKTKRISEKAKLKKNKELNWTYAGLKTKK